MAMVTGNVWNTDGGFISGIKFAFYGEYFTFLNYSAILLTETKQMQEMIQLNFLKPLKSVIRQKISILLWLPLQSVAMKEQNDYYKNKLEYINKNGLMIWYE